MRVCKYRLVAAAVVLRCVIDLYSRTLLCCGVWWYLLEELATHSHTQMIVSNNIVINIAFRTCSRRKEDIHSTSIFQNNNTANR